MRTQVQISGYVPLFNAAETVLAAVKSLLEQEPSIGEVFAVDDGSTDRSAELLRAAGVRVVNQPANLGRGAARAEAMLEAQNDLVVCCDATNVLPKDFCVRAASWFDDVKIAAVFGRITQNPGGDAVTRWRGRHLFKRIGQVTGVKRRGSLATYGAMVRRSAVLEVGNFDARLRHSEDAELGERLLARGWDVIQDPTLEVISIARNSLAQVMERYWRWNAGTDEVVSWGGYLKLIAYAAKSMAIADLKEGDWRGALISLYCPHYQFWRSWWRRHRRSVQR